MCSVLTLPVLAATAFRRRSFEPARLLRMHAIGTLGAGSALGLGSGWLDVRNKTAEDLRAQAKLLHSTRTECQLWSRAGGGSALALVSCPAVSRQQTAVSSSSSS